MAHQFLQSSCIHELTLEYIRYIDIDNVFPFNVIPLGVPKSNNLTFTDFAFRWSSHERFRGGGPGNFSEMVFHKLANCANTGSQASLGFDLPLEQHNSCPFSIPKTAHGWVVTSFQDCSAQKHYIMLSVIHCCSIKWTGIETKRPKCYQLRFRTLPPRVQGKPLPEIFLSLFKVANFVSES